MTPHEKAFAGFSAGRGQSVELILKEDICDEDLQGMKEVYQSAGWQKHSTDVIRQVFEASNVKVIVQSGNRIIGFGRAMSDGCFNAAIYDIVVHEEWQNRGIARKILSNLLDRLKDVSCVHLISTTGNEEFYRKCGFRKVKTGMARYVRPELSDEYLE
ncbi:GNAT family N-acetyltransferase [Rossellomorea sp. NS-SX7]|uniref:GNAT family N-acetyltransferase n=1 Tax=Rossellomorea sp. NS-SX7 TaxID=3463856 RepID=UPI00405959DD